MMVGLSCVGGIIGEGTIKRCTLWGRATPIRCNDVGALYQYPGVK